MRIRIANSALSDHLSRLYEEVALDNYIHIDKPDTTINIVQGFHRYSWIRMTLDAVAELRADMEYQVEFSEEDPDYRRQCRRVLATLDREGL